ncbi:hypothetical protein KJ641_04230 [Patescibacteria group bacterium]|nr:hypothetical protein [Patescibacteria group bacterium]MBU1896046.1 hypothetical protein [Patescibacteria group bacterium]
MAQKRIHNPSTGKYYAIRQKTTSSGKRGQIIGSYKSKSTAKSIKIKYGNVVKRLGNT